MLIMLYRPEKQAVAHYKYRFPFETHENCVKFHAELDLCQKRGLRRSTMGGSANWAVKTNLKL